jgi:phosphoenolpyruvate phosphomutase-like protein
MLSRQPAWLRHFNGEFSGGGTQISVEVLIHRGSHPVSVTQNEKAVRFRVLHDGPGAFVIPNSWDVSSAPILAGLGFQALATSSAALGRRDGRLTKDEALAHATLDRRCDRSARLRGSRKDWQDTEIMIRRFAEKLGPLRAKNHG